jgi:uncharacterized protein
LQRAHAGLRFASESVPPSAIATTWSISVANPPQRQHVRPRSANTRQMTETPNRVTEANRQTIRAAFDAWRDGTGTVNDVFAPEMVWRIEGHSLASKEYRNKQQFIDEVLAPFGARFSSSDPFRPTTIRSVYADGDTVIVLWDGRGTAKDGRPYENSYAWFMKLRDGKVIDGTAFYDSISFNDLWTRVQPRS